MSKQRKYTDDELVETVATSYSIRTVLEKIGLTPAGGNYETVKKHIQELKLDTSHFLGQNSITKMVSGPTILYRTLSSFVLIVIH